MYLTSKSSCLDNSFENKLNLLSKTSWFWSGIAPTFKTLGFENTGDEEIENNTYSYYQKRYEKIKTVNSRSITNHFAFHLSNPLATLIRNVVLKYLTKNKKFLENYLGKIYKN